MSNAPSFVTPSLTRALNAPWRALHQLSVLTKLSLLMLAMVAPLAVIGSLYWTKSQQDIRYAALERAGLADARALWPHLLAAATSPALCLHSEAVPLRIDGGYRPRELVMGTAPAVPPGPPGRACAGAETDAAILRTKTYMSTVADASRLILDPELPSYHAMDLTMLRMPELVAAMAQTTNTQSENSQLGDAMSLWMAFGRFDSALRGAQSASAAAIANHPDPEAGARLSVGLSDLSAAANALRLWAADYANTSGGFSDTAEAKLVREEFLAASDRLWRVAAHELDALLAARIERLNRALSLGVAMSAFALALAGLFMAYVARSIVHPQRRIAATITQLVDGDLDVRVPDKKVRNEVGAVARAVEVFRNAMIEREMLARYLEHERNDLEERVDRRTCELAVAQRAAEETAVTLELAMRTVKAGAYIVDRATGDIWCSDSLVELCGKPMRRADLQNGVWNLVIDEDRMRMGETVRAARAAGASNVSIEIRIRRHGDDALRWLHVAQTVRGDGRVVGVMMDVTARKEEALALAAAREAADAANAAKSAFLASMSHEIRTPLNGVLGMAGALQRTELAANQREMVRVITDSGAALLTVLNDVLDVSKIEAGKLDLEAVPFELGDAVRTVAQLYGEAASQKGVLLRVDLAEAPQSALLGDPTRVRQIVQNFLSNAVKFTERGEIAVRVRTLASNNEAVRVRIDVRDQGIGLTPEQKTRLFEKFAQADGTITRRYGGTGLGLSICRELATLMNGEIGCDSEVGVGSTFYLELSLPPAEPVPAPIPEPDARAPAEAPSLRVLAADDNPTNRLVLKTLLEQVDINAVFAVNGADAVAQAREQIFDLVLMDVHMPVLDGMNATREIRALGGAWAHIPIIALTADAMPANIAACLAAGMNAHVAKPIRTDVLFATIGAVLEEADADAAARAAA
jgi:signal transduction histidine kinase/HAMP domain-containing protein/ActR/RegA family two-component response regulator